MSFLAAVLVDTYRSRMSLTSNRVRTAHLDTHYLQQGTGDKAVVLIHGFPQTSHQWRHQIAALADAGYAVFAPDNRGFGATEKPGARVSRALLADDVMRFLDAIGVEKAILVGHDWGGIIAFKTAIDNPDRITRLGLLDTLCTVWSPAAVHGYWFKADGLAEELFRTRHREFIEVLFGGADSAALGVRPASPWPIPPGPRDRPSWISEDDLSTYVRAFSDPDVWAHAISYYRYALPFHVVSADADGHESFRSLSEREIEVMWRHPEGLEKHPLFAEFMDYGPEDRAKTFPNPALRLYGTYLGRAPSTPASDPTRTPTGNPFVNQFSRYFPDLRSQSIAAGHFLGEEAPAAVNEHLLAFCSGAL